MPFEGKNEKLRKNIANPKKNPCFTSKPWKQCSPKAKDLAKQLLNKDPLQRISVDEALNHPWFKETK